MPFAESEFYAPPPEKKQDEGDKENDDDRHEGPAEKKRRGPRFNKDSVEFQLFSPSSSPRWPNHSPLLMRSRGGSECIVAGSDAHRGSVDVLGFNLMHRPSHRRYGETIHHGSFSRGKQAGREWRVVVLLWVWFE